MTYFEFHLVFILPAILAAGVLARGARDTLGGRVTWSIPVLMVLALIWTTPWDNYLVSRGIWSYGNDRVIGTIGWVPVEEYLFFLLQPPITGWLLCAIMKRNPPRPIRSIGRTAGTVAWLALAGAGGLALGTTRGTYLGLIIAWAAPVAAAQWAFAARSIAGRAREVVLTVGVATAYLSVADAFAIRTGIWTIDPSTSTGVTILGLPVEEAVFFLLTNVLIAQGLVLLLEPPAARAS